MKNIDFENNEIKKEYKNLLKEENFLLNILYSLECEYQTIVIIDIIKEDDMTKIITKCDNTVININIDYEKNQTILSSLDWNYSIVYSNYATSVCKPIGKLYTRENRNILKKYYIKINSIYDKMESYELKINDKIYGIIIKEINKKINEQVIIDALLDNKNKIDNIMDIVKVLNDVLNIEDYEIKINGLNDNGNIVIIDRGKITKYVEYREKENYKEKIYLENNEFYVEKTVKEKFEEEIPLVKRIGERK